MMNSSPKRDVFFRADSTPKGITKPEPNDSFRLLEQRKNDMSEKRITCCASISYIRH